MCLLLYIFYMYLYLLNIQKMWVGPAVHNDNDHSDLCSTGPQFIWVARLKTGGI